MKIGHIALWTDRPDELKTFYVHYFRGRSNEKYVNTTKGFESFFVRFDGEAALEIMRRTDVTDRSSGEQLGWCHLAFTLDDREQVHALTERLRTDGYCVLSEPRLTGDGFYESVVADPDGNRIELVVE